MSQPDVLIIGAGPIGLATAIAAKRRGLSVILLEKGSVADNIRRYPTNMTFSSSAQLLEIGEVPFIARDYRPTRLDVVRYYQRVGEFFELDIRLHSRVKSIERLAGGFRAQSETGTTAEGANVVFATGYFDAPSLLGVPGEELPHVSHYFDEAVRYAGADVVVVGGRNSAVETSLDLYRSGARVTLVHRGEDLGHSVKYWLRPDLENRIRDGRITALFSTKVKRIAATHMIVEKSDGAELQLPAMFVFLLTGYHPDTRLLETAGVRSDPRSLKPVLDPVTRETNVEGVFVAGSASSGRETDALFIENSRAHGEAIATVIAERKAKGMSVYAAH